MARRKAYSHRGHLKPWSVVVVDALNKQPLPLDDLVAMASPVVPPGRGYRRARVTTNKVPVERSTEAGCRQIVRDSIRVMRNSGSIGTYELDGRVYCELTELGKRRLIVGRSR